MSLEPLTGLNVVDLFAGSGALGIEALSRGAVRVDFVDHARDALRTLEQNLVDLALDSRATVWPLELPRGLKRIAGPLAGADLVLVDPPYGGAEAREILAALGVAGVLQGGARVVVERHAKDVLAEREGVLEKQRERRYGETVVSFYRAVPAGSAPLEEESGS